MNDKNLFDKIDDFVPTILKNYFRKPVKNIFIG